ncbi:unnamed protein product [marine sediment metagenome]|uniref:Uncharacterized protein n=1 Tax=marine sediment metagenome TaxID=412755 RepID=X1JKX2_9ZZZZ
MSELLEGVLSEKMLDKLASDLGMEHEALRKHPFFRVLKGRVILTYPLTADFKAYFHEEELENDTSWYPPEGTLVYHAVISGAAPTAEMEFYFMTEAGYTADAFALIPLKAMQGPMYCNGTAFFRNSTGSTRTVSIIGRIF